MLGSLPDIGCDKGWTYTLPDYEDAEGNAIFVFLVTTASYSGLIKLDSSKTTIFLDEEPVEFDDAVVPVMIEL